MNHDGQCVQAVTDIQVKKNNELKIHKKMEKTRKGKQTERNKEKWNQMARRILQNGNDGNEAEKQKETEPKWSSSLKDEYLSRVHEILNTISEKNMKKNTRKWRIEAMNKKSKENQEKNVR